MVVNSGEIQSCSGMFVVVWFYFSLELLFLNRKLHGPSWIDVKYPRKLMAIFLCKYVKSSASPSFDN